VKTPPKSVFWSTKYAFLIKKPKTKKYAKNVKIGQKRQKRPKYGVVSFSPV
jgi:hypothetical protein